MTNKKLLIPIIGVIFYFIILYLVNAELDRLDDIEKQKENDLIRNLHDIGSSEGIFQMVVEIPENFISNTSRFSPQR